MYIVKLMNKEKIRINETEYKNILGKTGIVTLSSGISFNMASVEIIYPENKSDEVEDRKQQMTGMLHDGTLVRRHYGQWALSGTVPDDRGNDSPVFPDPTYYPEIAADCVPTIEEYERQYKHLPREERRKAIVGNVRVVRSGGSLEPIKNILKRGKV